MTRYLRVTSVALLISAWTMTIPGGVVHAAQGQMLKNGVSAAEKGFEKTGEALSKAGDEVADFWILTSVKTNLAGEGLLKGINVDCDQHVVTLHGKVPTEVWHTRAVDIARNTKGVHRVVDELAVGSKS